MESSQGSAVQNENTSNSAPSLNNRESERLNEYNKRHSHKYKHSYNRAKLVLDCGMLLLARERFEQIRTARKSRHSTKQNKINSRKQNQMESQMESNGISVESNTTFNSKNGITWNQHGIEHNI